MGAEMRKPDDEDKDESSDEALANYPNKKFALCFCLLSESWKILTKVMNFRTSLPLPTLRHYKLTSKGLYDQWLELDIII